jgi:hypothetical protein
MRFFLVFMVFASLFVAPQASSGIISKSLTGVIGYNIFMAGIRVGGPFAMKKGVAGLQLYLKKNPHMYAKVIGFMAGIAISKPELRDRAIEFIEKGGFVDKNTMSSIVESTEEYDQAFATVSSHLKDIDPEELCQKTRIHEDDYRNFMLKMSTTAKEFDVGSYGSMVRPSYAIVGDNLEHDHIPSSAAVKKHVKEKVKLKLSRAQNHQIHNNATTIEVRDIKHKIGRTWRGKNNPLQVALDAENLKDATFKDFAYHLINHGYSSQLMSSFVHAYKRNSTLCLYEK